MATATAMRFELSVDQKAIQHLARALRAEADGKQLRKDLVTDLKAAVEPGVTAIQGKLRSMPHRSAAHPSPALGTYVASRIKPQVRLSGKSTGVSIRVPQTPKIRGFKMAARRLNRKSWRHPVYGNRNVWVTQMSPIPGYFDETLTHGKPAYRRAVVEALEKSARRVASRVRS